jgi:hypothetical protein
MAIDFPQLTVPHVRGYDYAIGADVFTGSPKSVAVEGRETGVRGAEGPTVTTAIRRIQSTADLERVLGVDAAATYGAASFGAGISGRFSFARDAKVQNSSLFLAVIVTVELAFRSIDQPKLTSAAKRYAKYPAKFSALYGNSFVRGLGRGGIFVGLLRVDTSSNEEAEKISGEVKGGLQLFSAEAKGKFEKVKSMATGDIEVTIHHEGGPTDLAVTDPTDPVALLETSQRFLTALQEDPSTARPYFVTLAPYTIVPDAPAPDKPADLQHVLDILRFCAERRSELLDTLNSLHYISDHEANYDISNGASFEKVRTAVTDVQLDLDLVSDCAMDAIGNPSEAKLPADFAKQHGKEFPRGRLPDPLPLAKPQSKLVRVPNFSECRSWDECLHRGADVYLIQQTLRIEAIDRDFHVLEQSPAPGVEVPGLSPVTIFTAPIQGPPTEWSFWELVLHAPSRFFVAPDQTQLP